MPVLICIVFCLIAAVCVGVIWHEFKVNGASLRDPRDRRRAMWAIAAAVNFLAFLLHGFLVGAMVFPGRGTFERGVYVVVEHGRRVQLSPMAFFLSYAHDIAFVAILIACMIAIIRLRPVPPGFERSFLHLQRKARRDKQLRERS